jgi:hypothetical protein
MLCLDWTKRRTHIFCSCAVTPERIKLSFFQRLLKKVYNNNELARFVIDEVAVLPIAALSITNLMRGFGRRTVFLHGVPISDQVIGDSGSCDLCVQRYITCYFHRSRSLILKEVLEQVPIMALTASARQT